MRVLVELDRWHRRGEMRAESREDGSTVSLHLSTPWNNKIRLIRSIELGDYCLNVSVEEYRGESFFLRASVGLREGKPRKRRRSRHTAFRERPLKVTVYPTGDFRWLLSREGVFAELPEAWNEDWANAFIEETLNALRSPEIPKHYELHGDNPEEF